MDMNSFLTTLLATQNPVLPDPAVMAWAQRLAWGLLLASGALLIGGRLARPYRLGLGLFLLLWTLWPGPAAPAYWLSLAFQSPSLMSAAVCLLWVAGAWPFDPWSGGDAVPENTRTARKVLVALGVVLGWVLLFDSLGWLPLSLYNWGFGALACATVILLASLLWLVFGTLESALPLLMAGLFVLSRLPSGNVWDALIDPLLWIALQLGWLVSAWRGRRRAQ